MDLRPTRRGHVTRIRATTYDSNTSLVCLQRNLDYTRVGAQTFFRGSLEVTDSQRTTPTIQKLVPALATSDLFSEPTNDIQVKPRGSSLTGPRCR